MGVAAAVAVAAVAVSAASAYVAYDGAKTQARLGREQADSTARNAALSAELTRTQRASLVNQSEIAGIEAREQETERRRRASGADDANIALAAFAGLGAGSIDTIAAENRRLMGGDVGAIRLLGQSRAIQFAGQETGAAMQGYGLEQRQRFAKTDSSIFAGQESTAWVRPTLSLLGAGLNAQQSGAFSGTSTRVSTTGPNGQGGATAPGMQFP